MPIPGRKKLTIIKVYESEEAMDSPIDSISYYDNGEYMRKAKELLLKHAGKRWELMPIRIYENNKVGLAAMSNIAAEVRLSVRKAAVREKLKKAS